MGTFKVNEEKWDSFLPIQFKYSTLNSISSTLLSINRQITSISERIDNVDKISGISYSEQSNKINNAISHMSSIETYVNQTIRDIEDLLDDEFFSRLNDENGSLESLQLVADKKYTTKNTLGITEQTTYNEYSTNTSNAYMSGQVTKTGFRTTEKEMIGFEDIFKMSNKNSDHNFKGFSGILRNEYELIKKELKKQGKTDKIDFDDYMNSIINAGKFDHTVDKGWRNWASTALDSIGIISLVSKFTGNDFLTGEKYTEAEKDAASLNIAFSILGFATLGIGKGVHIGGKAVAIYVTGEIATSVVIEASTGFLDEMGAPKWLQGLTALAAGVIIGKKVDGFIDTGVKSIDDILEIGLKNFDDIGKLGIKNIDDLMNIGVKNVDDLLKMGVKNSDDLLKLGIKNADDLAKLGVKNIDDLKKLGIQNAAELNKLGINNIDDYLKKVNKGASGATYKSFDESIFNKYIDEIENITNKKLSKTQLDELADALKKNEYTKLNAQELLSARKEFNSSKKALISKWEEMTGEKWPVYSEDVISPTTGKVLRKAGDRYDAHHIVELSNGGNNEWWNLHPAKFPNEHQGGIHGTNGLAGDLFK